MRREELAAQLHAMLDAGARESRLVLRARELWLVVSHTPALGRWRITAPASHRLPTHLRLGQAQGQRLRELGYAKPGRGRGDFEREVQAPAAGWVEAELPAELLGLLEGIYGAPTAQLEPSLIHDDREHPSNPTLIAAMTRVSTHKDQVTRMELYNALANSTLMVALEPEAAPDPKATPTWQVALREQERPIYDLFTDWENFRLAHPLEHRYEPVHGSELFDRAQALRTLALNFNPSGPVGGQIYAGEIDDMVTALARWRAKHSS